MGGPTTGIEVAKTLEKLGRLNEALDVARSIGTARAAPGEPRVFGEARAAADALAAKLAARIPSLVIDVRGVPDGAAAVVRVDRTAVPAAALGSPRAVDPGAHVVTAEVAGRRAARVEVSVDEAQRLPVVLTLAPVVASSAAPAGQPGPRAPVDTTAGGGGLSTLGIVAFGAAGAGVAVGAVTGIASLAKASSAKQGCHGNVCPAANRGDADASTSLATASDVAFGVAILGVAVGVYEIVTRRPPPPHPTPARLDPLLLPGGAGVLVRF
ncbi:MAG TPA: hypothetical protein VHB21_08340, partial [Minicystis sp.]|nr:hypothetical protein [Minicystis sp.]